MNELQVFNFDELDVRTMMIEDEPHFVGVDVAKVLGYKNYRNAINNKVDDEDKVTKKVITGGQRRAQTLINKTGLYSLLSSCRMPNTSEVYEDFINIVECDKDILLIRQKRKEHKFGEMLKTLTDLDWQEQYPINNGQYKIDFYYEGGLIVEYDEKHHDYQNQEDKERMDIIRNVIAEENEITDGERFKPAVIRVKEGEELTGIKRVIDYIKYAGMEDVIPKEPELDYNAEFSNRERTKII